VPATRIPLVVLRLLAAAQITLGIAFWTGHWYSLVSLHRMGGMLFVVTLWVIALLALRAKRAVGLAAFALAWGVVIAGLGFAQQRLLIGDLHWIVRVAHLVISMSAMPLAERLARDA
jgi:hypothetical protein